MFDEREDVNVHECDHNFNHIMNKMFLALTRQACL